MSTFAARAERVAAVAARHADAVDREGRFPEEAVAALKAERLLGLQIPGQFGGEGLGSSRSPSSAARSGRLAARPRWCSRCTTSRCRAS